MPYTGWVSFAGMELVNDARAQAYADLYDVQVEAEECEALRAWLGDAPYVSPIDDDAPWYDPGVPESAAVLGYVGLDVAGLEAPTWSRETTALLSEGANVGPLRRGPREVVVRVAAFALGDAARVYAASWLGSVVRGSVCPTTGGQGDALCLLAHCPLPGSTGRELRTLADVGILDGPTVTGVSDMGTTCDGDPLYAVELEMTFVVGSPHIFRPGTVVADTVPLAPVATPGSPMPNPDDCPGTIDIATDPDCPQPTLPAPAPVAVDPCACVHEDYPLRQAVVLPGSVVPGVYEKVPNLRIFTGSADMRCVNIRWYMNPASLTPDRITADPCAACAQISVPFLPANCTLYIDGTVQAAWIEPSNTLAAGLIGDTGVATFSPTNPVTLYGPNGRAFEWPVFECAMPMVVEVSVTPTAPGGPDATLYVELVPREDLT